MKRKLILMGLTVLLVFAQSCNKEKIREKVIEVQEVKLECVDITLLEGGTKQLVVNILPEDAKDRNIIWNSSDEKIASVSTQGLVTAIGLGEVEVTAESANGKKAVCKVIVSDGIIHVTGVKITSQVKEIAIREVVQLTAEVIPANASNDIVAFYSSDPKIAIVDLVGTITGVSEGTVTVTATSSDGKKTDECTIVVKSIPVTYVKINPRDVELEVGATKPLVVTFTPENATNISGEWWSKDETVATVDKSGVVTAISEGVANIVFCHNNNYDMITTCNVTVVPMIIVDACIDADGREYKTVKIGEQEWMAENLAYIPEGTLADGAFVYDYNGSSVSDAKATEEYINYGVLYEYDLILKTDICPKGWHIPSDAEWKELQMFLGMSQEEVDLLSYSKYPGDIAPKMKSTSLWLEDDPEFKASNETGLSIVPSGMKKENGICLGLGKRSVYWTTTEIVQNQISWPNPTAKEMLVRKFYGDENGICRFAYPTNRCYSVRCVKNK